MSAYSNAVTPGFFGEKGFGSYHPIIVLTFVVGFVVEFTTDPAGLRRRSPPG